jgi:hypothetical protein
MPEFITPANFSGASELTASTGLAIIDQGRWQFSQAGYNDGVSFGLSLGWPDPEFAGSRTSGAPPPPRTPISGGRLLLRAQGWSIPGGNELTAYTDPITHVTYPAEDCRITITGAWVVIRRVNSNSFNGPGVEYQGRTATDQGSRDMDPWLLSYTAGAVTYVIQGSGVEGGALDTFTGHVFECEVTESARTNNSNYAFQSNSVTTPAWVYVYQRQWQVATAQESAPANRDLMAAIQQFRQTKS